MKKQQNAVHRGMLGRGLAVLVFSAAIMGFASVGEAVYSLPASRVVTWQGNAGVAGDIPARGTVYKTLTPTGGDDTSAIQTAITNCPTGQVVQLGRGTFSVTSLNMKSGVTLRGAGMGATILKGATTSSSYVIALGNNSFALGTPVNLAGGYTKGSSGITTSTTPGWAAGDVILIDQLQNPSGDPPVTNLGDGGNDTWDSRSSGTRPLGQVVKVTAVSGTSATLEIPLHWTFDSSLAPQGTKITIYAHDAGVENLSIDSTASFNVTSSNLQKWSTVEFYGAANCWLLDVEINGVWGQGVGLQSAYRNTIRSSRVHNAHQHTTSAGYAMLMTWGAGANLIEDCIFDDLSNGPVIAGASSGNIFAYNYSTHMYSSQYPNTIRAGLQSNHGAHPVMNLFEGNYLEGAYMSGDNYWGSSSNATWFRNRVYVSAPVTSGYTQQLQDLLVAYHQTYYNLVGNIIGTAGFENTYQSTVLTFSTSVKDIYVLGWLNNGGGIYGLETSTLIRHGNWDSVNNTVLWDPNSPDHTLPPSLYLTAKPGWWTNMPWPAIGPDLTPMSGSIPARQRYLLTPPMVGAPAVK